MKIKRLRTNASFAGSSLSRLVGLVLLSALAFSFQSAVLAQATDRFRFTEGLILEEIAPGIEYGQTRAGQANNEEKTGPWLINVLRVDLKRAQLKVVHAHSTFRSNWRASCKRRNPGFS